MTSSLERRLSAERERSHQHARENFDLDRAFSSLPPPAVVRPGREDHEDRRGAAGKRLRGNLRSTINDTLLREFARSELGALRCSAQYLEALRVVLGNQAHAEERGYVIELNIRVPFTSERTMRTIVEQMRAAKITFGRSVGLGQSRRQVVQCFGRRSSGCGAARAPRTLERMYRRDEGEARSTSDLWRHICDREVPH